MKELPLSVVISALIHQNKILLIKRARGDYVGFWCLPGGKIENNEHLSEAAVREIAEESGIRAKFKNSLGLVSEHLVENGNIIQHFLLHVCELVPETTEITKGAEGKLSWFSLDEIDGMKDKIIPSDFLMIEKMVKRREKSYYNCILEKSGDSYALKKFK